MTPRLKRLKLYRFLKLEYKLERDRRSYGLSPREDFEWGFCHFMSLHGINNVLILNLEELVRYRDRPGAFLWECQNLDKRLNALSSAIYDTEQSLTIIESILLKLCKKYR